MGKHFPIPGVVDPTAHPFLHFVLIVAIIVSEVNTRNPTVAMLAPTFIVIDHSVTQAKYGALQETGVNAKLHASFLFFWSTASIRIGRSVVPYHICMN